MRSRQQTSGTFGKYMTFELCGAWLGVLELYCSNSCTAVHVSSRGAIAFFGLRNGEVLRVTKEICIAGPNTIDIANKQKSFRFLCRGPTMSQKKKKPPRFYSEPQKAMAASRHRSPRPGFRLQSLHTVR